MKEGGCNGLIFINFEIKFEWKSKIYVIKKLIKVLCGKKKQQQPKCYKWNLYDTHSADKFIIAILKKWLVDIVHRLKNCGRSFTSCRRLSLDSIFGLIVCSEILCRYSLELLPRVRLRVEYEIKILNVDFPPS